MKKIMILMLGTISLLILQNCSSSKNLSKKEEVVSFDKDVMPILKVSCTPCHFPPDGKKEPLNTYETVKKNFDNMLARVKLPSTDNKFMPFKNKKPALSDSAINVLVKWQAQNMPQ